MLTRCALIVVGLLTAVQLLACAQDGEFGAATAEGPVTQPASDPSVRLGQREAPIGGEISVVGSGWAHGIPVKIFLTSHELIGERSLAYARLEGRLVYVGEATPEEDGTFVMTFILEREYTTEAGEIVSVSRGMRYLVGADQRQPGGSHAQAVGIAVR